MATDNPKAWQLPTPVCYFCNKVAVAILGKTTYVCEEHGKKYSGYNSFENKLMRGEVT